MGKARRASIFETAPHSGVQTPFTIRDIDMQDEQPTRRAFLQRISLLGAVIGAGTALAGCAGGESEGEATASAENVSCNDDLSGLTAEELQAREQVFRYVDRSPNPAEVCDNCQFWQPDQGGAVCGGCQLLKGPVHPQGYCISWAPLPEAVS